MGRFLPSVSYGYFCHCSSASTTTHMWQVSKFQLVMEQTRTEYMHGCMLWMTLYVMQVNVLWNKWFCRSFFSFAFALESLLPAVSDMNPRSVILHLLLPVYLQELPVMITNAITTFFTAGIPLISSRSLLGTINGSLLRGSAGDWLRN